MLFVKATKAHRQAIPRADRGQGVRHTASVDVQLDRGDDDEDAEPERKELDLASLRRLLSRGPEIANGAIDGGGADKAILAQGRVGLRVDRFTVGSRIVIGVGTLVGG